MLSKSHLTTINTVVVEKGLLGRARPSFHLRGSGEISRTEDKRANIITKDAPFAHIAREMPRVLAGAMDEGQIYEKHVLVTGMTKYMHSF